MENQYIQENDSGDNMIITDPPLNPVLNKDINFGRNTELYPDALLSKQRRSHFITIPQTTQDLNLLNNIIQKISKTIKYSLISKEEHKDDGIHYHICISFSQPISVKQIHTKLLQVEGNIQGSINYQEVKKIGAVITYIKKDGNFIEQGDAPKQSHSKPNNMEQLNEDLSLILSDDISVTDALLQIKEKQPAYYIQHSDKIKKVLEENIITPKWDYIKYTNENTELKPYQKKVWEILQQPPKPRQIIWVEGKPSTGKSFLFNYIQENYKYKLYSAGQSASLDSVIYGYDEEGVIAWDIPKSYDFTTLGDALSSTIEKFSDFGQILTSKKYTGKKVRVLGHVIIFSNHGPLEQLKHRDIIYINTAPNMGLGEEDRQLKRFNITKKIKHGKTIWEHKLSDDRRCYYYNQDDINKLIDSLTSCDDEE